MSTTRCLLVVTLLAAFLAAPVLAQDDGGPRRPPPGGPGGPGGHGGPGGPGGPGGMRPPGPPPPPPDWDPPAELVAKVKSAEPEYAAHLDKVKTSDPGRWTAELWHYGQESRHAARMREQGETDRADRLLATGRLERKARAQVAALDGKKPSAEQSAALRSTLGELFDLREETRREEITELEQRITELKSGLADRRAKKDEIVSRRLEQLLAESDQMGW